MSRDSMDAWMPRGVKLGPTSGKEQHALLEPLFAALPAFRPPDLEWNEKWGSYNNSNVCLMFLSHACRVMGIKEFTLDDDAVRASGKTVTQAMVEMLLASRPKALPGGALGLEVKND